MKIAYLILCHKNPDQINYLIKTLLENSECEIKVFLHVDKSVDLGVFKKAIPYSNVIFVKRFFTKWGSLNLVKAVLSILRSEIYLQTAFDFTILLSGQDLPVKSQNKIYEFLKRNIGKSFIEYKKMPVPELQFQGLDRFEKYHFYIGSRKFTYPLYPKKYGLLDKILSPISGLYFKAFVKRDFFNLDLYYGSQWWILSQESVSYIIQYLKNNPTLIEKFRYTWIADEHFFQTVLLTNHNKDFRARLINDHKRFMIWDKPGVRLPAFVDFEDLGKLKESNFLFGRKFDENYRELHQLILAQDK